MKRRSLLAGVPAAAAAAAAVVLPSVSAAAGEAPSAIAALFREWHALYRRYHDVSCSDEEMNVATDKLFELEQRIVALPSRDVHDLAVKIIVETSYRSFNLGDHNEAGCLILAEAEALGEQLL